MTTTDSKDHNFIHTFKFKDLSREKLQAISLNPTFKVLAIVDCPSVAELSSFLQTENFADIFRETLNFFFIDVSVWNEFNGFTEADFGILNQIFPETRPWIIQISPCGFDPIIYYKEENSTTLHKVEKVDITSAELKRKLLDRDGCNLSLLLQALQFDINGDFSWQNEMLDTKLTKNKSRNQLTNIVASQNVLCSRFLKLFEKTLDDEQWSGRVLAVINCKEISSLLAFLDHPFTVRDCELQLTNNLREQLFRVDSQNKNLLMLATETNNVEAVKYLLRFGFNLAAYGTDNRTAVDIAWDNKFYECFKAIIEEDSQFPSCFSPSRPYDVKQIPCGADRDAIAQTLNEKERFFTGVREGNLEVIKTLVNSNPRMKKCYSTSNKTALTLALEYRKFDVYSYLRSEGFSEENDSYFSGVYASLKDWEKNNIRDVNMKLFQKIDQPYLTILLSKSRMSFGSKTRNNCYQIIAKIYSVLNEVDEVSAIMKLISSSELLEIVFDFNSDNVRDMDPSSSENTLGKMYFKKGYLYVGVLKHETDFRGILGTLAHEMCHFAMHLVYDNRCLPFRQNDRERRAAYEKVFDETFKLCQQQADSSSEPKISDVFNDIETEDKNGKFSEREKGHVGLVELIVRVPHVITQYKGDHECNEMKLSDLECVFSSLFKYYRDFVHEDIVKQCKINDGKRLIKEINSSDPLLNSIRINGNRLKSPKVIEASTDNKIRILSSNVSELTLTSIYQSYLEANIKNIESSHIFLSVESLEVQEVVETLKIALKSTALPDLIIDCNNKVKSFKYVLKRFLKEIEEKQRITLIMSQKESLILERELFEDQILFCLIEVEHSWHELSDDFKNSLIQTEINFQGVSIKCGDLLGVTSEVLRDFPLSDVKKGNLIIKVGQALSDPSHKFYLLRKFVHRSENSEKELTDLDKIFDLKALINLGKSEKVVIISGQPGSGKSSVLYHFAKDLKEQNPKSWVSLVDLKQNIKSFESWSKENGENVESFEKFFIEIVLAKEELFGQGIFKSLFSSGKAFILLDGFDEISPNFKELILKFVSSFKIRTGNQLWVTSRSHLENDLEKALKCKSFHFVSLTKEDQVNFLARSFEHSENSFEQVDVQYRQKAQELIERLSEKVKLGSRSIGLPMLLQMLAAAYDEKTSEQNVNVNLMSIYEKFISDIIDRWMNKGGIYKQDHKQITMKSADIFEVHSKIAINYIYGSHSKFESINNLAYNKVVWDRERLARVGIVHFNSDDETPQFSHQTFAEYLVARFIFESFKEFDESQVLALEIFFHMISDEWSSKMVRIFLNEMLQGFKFEPTIQKSFAAAFNEALESKKTYGILGFALPESHHNLVSFILETVNDENLVKILSNAVTFMNRANVFCLAADYCDDKMISFICNAIQRLNSSSDREEILLAKSFRGQSVLHLAAQNRKNESAFETVWDQIKNFFEIQKQNQFLMQSDGDGRNLLHFAFTAGEKKFRNIFTVMTNSLTKLQIQELAISKDNFGDLPFHSGLKNNSAENLKFVCERVKEAFTTEENVFDFEGYRKLFSEQPLFDANIFFFVSRFNKNSGVLKFLWNWMQAEKIFSLEELKTLIKVVDKYDRNLLHVTIEKKSSKGLQELFQIIIKNFNPVVERKSFLFEKNQDKANALQLAIINRDSTILDVLLSSLNNLLEQEDVTLLFNTQCRDSVSIFHYAAHNIRNVDNFFSLHDWIKKNKVFSDVEMSEILAQKDFFNRNFLHLIGRNCGLDYTDSWDSEEESVIKLIEFLEIGFTTLDIQNLLLALDNDGYTCLLLAVSERSKPVVETYFKLVKHFITDPNERNLYLKKCCIKNRNIFQCAASNSKYIFPIVATQLIDVLKPEEINFLLLHQSDDGSSVLHDLIKRGYENDADTLNFFFDVLVERYLNQDEAETLLKYENANKETAFQFALCYASSSGVEIVFNFIKKSLKLETQKSLVQQVNPDGKLVGQCISGAAQIMKNHK